MQRAARTFMVLAASAGGIVALAFVAKAPALLGSILAITAAIAWCRFLERSATRPW